MDVVKKIEKMGSRSGAPKKTITIADSGEITTGGGTSGTDEEKEL